MKLARTHSDLFNEAKPASHRANTVKAIRLASNGQTSRNTSQQEIESSGITKTGLNTSLVHVISDNGFKLKDRFSNNTERTSTIKYVESRRSSQNKIGDTGKTTIDFGLTVFSSLSTTKGQKLNELQQSGREIRPKSFSGMNSKRDSIIEDASGIRANNTSTSRPYLNHKHSINTSSLFFVDETKGNLQDYNEKVENINIAAKKLLKEGFGDEKITYAVNKSNLHMKFLIEKAHSKLILFPDTEKNFFENLLVANEQILALLKTIQLFIHGILKENENLKKQTKEAIRDIKIQRDTVEELKAELLRTHETFSTKQILEILKETKEKAERAERVWIVEKQQMAAEIETLYAEIAELKATDHVSHLKKRYDALQSLTTIEMRRYGDEDDKKMNEIIKLEGLIGNANLEMREMRKELKFIRERHLEVDTEAKKVKEQASKYFEMQNRYREIAFMSKEELSQLTEKYNSLLQSAKQSHVKYALLQSKFDLLKKRMADLGGFYVDESSKDLKIIQEVKEVFKSVPYSIFGLKRYNLEENTLKKGSDNLQMGKYTLSKPGFCQLVQQKEIFSPLESDRDNRYNTFEIDREFIAIIRGIFDSKYNEFTYYNNYKQYTAFLEFVYSWLGSFHICPIQKRVKVITVDENINIESRKQKFRKFLSHPHISKLWDVSTFKDFLEEKLSSDELFFYLHCRYVLFQGPQLESCLGSAVNIIHWLRFEKVETALKIIVIKIDPDQYETLKKKLQQKCRIRKDKIFVDSALVLRALLEMYRNDKKAKLGIMREHFLDLCFPGKNSKMEISFDRFQQYLQINFPFVCDIGKVKLYRDSWCVGNGVVDVDTFFAIANENNLFVQSLKRLLLQEILPPRAVMDENEYQEKSKQLIKLLQKEFREVSDAISQCKIFAENLGIAEVITNIGFKEKELTQSFFDSQGEQGQALYLVFTELIQIVERTRNHYCFVHKYTQENDQKWIQRDIECLEIMGGSIREYALKEQVNWMEKEKKAKKIQKFFKCKKSNWYKLMEIMMNKVHMQEKKTKVESKAGANADF